MSDEIKDFNSWYIRLLNVNASNGQYGLDYPLGACCYRDILRDKKVKEALKEAWDKLIEVKNEQ
jgi:hypothetical protein